MFERYDEPARRTLFFARWEASELGARSIEGAHLLLGLIREPKGAAAKVLSVLPLADLRKELERTRDESAPKPPIEAEIPFSIETKRVLEYALEEADQLQHRHIGPEHLLLGLMREEESAVASTLARYGLRLDEAREHVRALSDAPPSKVVSNVAARVQIEQIMERMTALNVSFSENPEIAMRLALLHMDLEALKSLLDDPQ